MLIGTQTSRSTTPGPRTSRTNAQTLIIPAMVAALLMAAALTGCSSAPQQRESANAQLIHTGAVGQDNGNLTGNFATPRGRNRQRNILYASATSHTVLSR